MHPSEKLALLERLVDIPLYGVAGYTRGWLVYSSTKRGTVSLWSLRVSSGEEIRLTRGPVHGYARPRHPSPRIVFVRDVAEGRELHRIYSVDAGGGVEEVFVDAPPMRIFGLAYDGERLAFSGATMDGMALYLSRGGGFEKLVDLDVIAVPSDVSGRYVVGEGFFRGDPRSTELFIYDLESGEVEIYTPLEGSVNKAPRLNGSRILFESNYEGRNRLYVYDVETGEISEAPMKGGDYPSFNPVEHVDYGWTLDGRVWAIGVREGRSRAFIDGYEIPSPTGFVGSLALDEEGRAYYAASSLTEPPRIYSAIPGEGYRVIVDNPLPPEIAERLGAARHVWYRSGDCEAPAFVVESRVAGRPGPTVVYVHGGPWSSVVDAWSILVAGIVVSGYHVVAPNYRGSTGYGEEWRARDIGDPGGGDYGDVLAARNWAVENGLASRVAIMGYSYGGYMAYLALGKSPDSWDAGIAGAGIIDWVEMYGLSDALFRKFIEALFDGYREDLMRERSPITYVDNVRTPLCIIHPQNDTRTPLKPVLRYMSRLLERGSVFEAHILPSTGHRISTTEDIVNILFPAIRFLDRYLAAEKP